MDHDALDALLRVAVRYMPDMPSAACKGNADPFDRSAVSPPARAEALKICKGCPTLDACRQFLTSLASDERPRGVMGGAIVLGDGRIVEPPVEPVVVVAVAESTDRRAARRQWLADQRINGRRRTVA